MKTVSRHHLRSLVTEQAALIDFAVVTSHKQLRIVMRSSVSIT